MEAEDSGNFSPEWPWRRLAPAGMAVVFCCKKNPQKNQADAPRQEEKDGAGERSGGALYAPAMEERGGGTAVLRGRFWAAWGRDAEGNEGE